MPEAVARRNVAAYRLRRRVRVLKSDMFSALGGQRYDLIVANPPYVSAAVMRKLPREHRHEPKLALAGGNDGFDGVDRLVLTATDELLGVGRIGDDNWGQLNAELTTHQVMDLIFVVGTYSMLAMAFETWGLQPEADSAALPDATTGQRGWKRHPGGMRVGSGGSPARMGRSRPPASGTTSSNAFV